MIRPPGPARKSLVFSDLQQEFEEYKANHERRENHASEFSYKIHFYWSVGLINSFRPLHNATTSKKVTNSTMLLLDRVVVA